MRPLRTRGSNPVDDSGQVSSWLLKILFWVAILGFVLIEFGSVVIVRIQTGDVAGQTAQEAGIAYSNTGFQRAEARAEEYAELNDAVYVDDSLEIRQEEDEICVTVRKTASTFVIHRIDALEGLTEAEATECAPLRN